MQFLLVVPLDSLFDDAKRSHGQAPQQITSLDFVGIRESETCEAGSRKMRNQWHPRGWTLAATQA